LLLLLLLRPCALLVQREFLGLISTGQKYCVASKGPMTLEGAWLWDLKDWIDRKCVGGRPACVPPATRPPVRPLPRFHAQPWRTIGSRATHACLPWRPGRVTAAAVRSPPPLLRPSWSPSPSPKRMRAARQVDGQLHVGAARDGRRCRGAECGGRCGWVLRAGGAVSRGHALRGLWLQGGQGRHVPAPCVCVGV
jgi:hypothetical protein